MRELSTLLLGITVSAYWFCVGAMIVRVSRRSQRMVRLVIPAQRIERMMWVIWVPLVAAWIAMPFVAPVQDPNRHPWLGMPNIVKSHAAVQVIRLMAAGFALVCLLLSIKCWRRMGRNWRMGVDPAQRSELIVDGPFARVRHPIYALSVALMLCSVVVIPTPVMLAIAALHIALMYLKACNEEQFLFKMRGQSYSEYCQRTGRFLPRIRASR